MNTFPFYFCLVNTYLAAMSAKQISWTVASFHIVVTFAASLYVFPRQKPVR